MKLPRRFLAITCLLIPALTGRAADQTWTGGSLINGNWSTTGNWLDGAAPGSTSVTTSTDVATFSSALLNGWGTLGTPIVIDSPTQNIAGLTFTGAAGSFVIGSTGGNALRLSNAGSIQLASGLTSTNVTQTINAPLVLQGTSYSFTNDSALGGGTLVIGGGITGTTGATTLTLSGTNTSANTVSGSIGNGSATSLAVTKSGTGTWVLSGANTYTGTTTVSGGTLNISGAGNANTSDIVMSNGANLTFTAADTRSFSKAITGTAGTIIFNVAGNTTASGGADSTSFTLSNTGSFSGTLVVNTGLVSFSSNAAFGATANVIQLNAASGQSAGLLVGGNTTLPSSRAIQLTTAGGNGIFRAFAGTILQISGQISGAGNLVKTDSGTLLLTGANTYTGATTISVGTLQLGNGGTTGSLSASSALTIAGGTLIFNRSNAVTQGTDFPAVISSGAGGVRLNGPGALTLSGANAYTGATTVNGGTLVLAFGTVSSNIISAFSPLNLGGGTLQLTGNGTQTFAGLTTSAGTGSRILMGASQTLTLGTLSSAGGASALNFNTAAGGADAATTSVGSALITLTGGTLLNGWTVTDSTGFGLAARNGSNQIIRDTATTLLPASGATPVTNYRIDNNAGGAAAAGSSTLAITASQAASSITVDTSAGNGAVTLGSGVALSSSTWNFGGTGSNTWGISGSAGGASLQAAASGTPIEINNYASGTVTLSAPILAFGTNNVNFKGTGTTVLAGVNTYTGQTTVHGGTLEVPTGGSIAQPASNLVVGGFSGEHGTLRLTGGSVSNSAAILGFSLGSSGTANVSGGAWTSSGNLTVGSIGTGVLNLSGTGAISNTTATLGTNAGSLGTATVSGGTWTSSSTLTVGSSGTGVLNLSGTGAISNAGATLGNAAGSQGTANVSGGTWTSSGNLTVGSSGTGVLNLTGGTVHIGGVAGTGTVTLGSAVGSSGTLNLGTGSTVGTLNAATVTGGSGTAVLYFNHTGSLTLAANLTGSLVVNKLGAGTTILSGTNTYTGATTITEGTLQIGSGGITGALAPGSAITNNGTLAFNRSNTITQGTHFATVISGSGGVTQLGTGILILSGTNTYTGATAVTGGVLQVTGSTAAASAVGISGGALGGTGTVNGAVTLSSTGGIKLTDTVVGTLTLGSTLEFTGAAGAHSLSFDLASAGSTTDKLAVSGAVTMTTPGAAVVSLNQINGAASRLTAGTYDLITGSAVPSSGNFTLATTKAFGQSFALTGTATQLQLTTTLSAAGPAAAFWSGAAGVNWSAAGNWNTNAASNTAAGAAPGYQSNVTFATTTPVASNLTTNVVDADFDINSLTFNGAAGGVTIGGSKMLTIEARAVNSNPLDKGITSSNSSGTNTISAPVGLAANQTWTVASGGMLAVSSAVSDFGGGYTLTKAGTGTLILSGASTYTGTTVISAGVLNLQNGSGLGTPLAGTSVTSGAALQLQGGITTLAEALTLNDTGISSTGALRNLSGDNTYAGLLTLGSATRINSDAGTLTLSHSGTITGATFGLTVGGAGNTTIQSVIGTTTGSLTKDGTGTLTLNGTSTYTGATTVNGGTLKAGVSGALGINSRVTLADVAGVTLDLSGFSTQIGSLSGGGASGGNVTLGTATLIVGGSTFPQPFAGVISGSGGALTQSGSGRLILTGANTYTGATTISVGTLQLGNGGTTGSLSASSALSIASGATLIFNRSNAVTQGTDFPAVISSGAGAVTQNGPGILTLSGANVYTGRTTVNGGTLVLAFGTVSTQIISAASPLTLGGGTLQLTGNGTQTFAGLTTSADTGSRIVLGASQTLTLGALTSAGTSSSLNFNTAAGGADAATTSVGSSLITLTGGAMPNSWTVTDSTGFGLAARNGSNQIIRDTATTLLPASGATFGTNYRIDNNAGGAAAAGSSTLAITASQAASSIIVDTSAGNGAATLGSGVVLSSNTWNFGGTGSNTWGISGSAGGAGLRAAASGNTMEINNYASGTVTLSAPILALGTNAVNFKGTGTTVLAGANTYTGVTTVRGGTLEVPTGGSIAQPASILVVGNGSGENGTLRLTGGSISNTTAFLGAAGGSLGTATVSAGTWTSGGALTVGSNGTGVLNLSGTGAISNTTATLGSQAGSQGTATVSGGTWTSSGSLTVGNSGTGVLNLSGAGAISNTAATLGANAGSLGTATVSGGTWTSSSSLTVGTSGTGVLNLSGTGAISNTGATLGQSTGSSGTASVSSGTWTNSASLIVGDSGTGVLNLSGTGAISNSSATLGNFSGSLGTANVSGGTWTSSPLLFFVGGSGTGVLNLSGTGTISTASVRLGANAGSLGTANVSGGTWTSSGNLFVGYSGTGVLNLSGTGAIGNSTAILGFIVGSLGTANVSSGTWTSSGAITVGDSGTGVVNLSGGAVSSSFDSFFGNSAGSSGTATVSSGTWTNLGHIFVGNSGTGVLNVTGGTVSNTNGILGYFAGSQGTANVSGGSWTSSGTLTVGDSGTGVLNLSGTGAIGNTQSFLGSGAGSLGTANVSGGTWTSSSGVSVVGSSGTGVINLTGGTVHVGGVAGTGNVFMAENSGSSGTLNLGTGGTVGTLNAGTVTGGSGTAVVNFNHTGSFTFDKPLTGSLAVNKLGAGTTTLSATANNYTGGTTVSGGTLNLTNASGSATGTGSLLVTSTGTLSGTGALNAGANAITLNGTLTIGDTTLGSPVASSLTLGTTSGTGITLGATGSMRFDLFSRDGPGGDNTGILTASDLLLLTGDISILPGATLIIENPNAMTAWALGDMWQLWSGPGTRTGTFSLANIIAPSLSSGLAWDFNTTTGILAIAPEPSRAVLVLMGLCAALLRRRR